MIYRRFRFANKREAIEAMNSFSVSNAIGREILEYKRLGDKYPFREKR